MHGVVDILAVGGFWFFLTALVFRGAIKEKYLKAGLSNSEIKDLNARVAALESRLALVGSEMAELREIQDFDRKLLGKSESKAIMRQSQQTIAR